MVPAKRTKPTSPVKPGRRADIGAPTTAWFDALDGALAPLAARVATLIRDTAPNANEALKWGMPCWSAANGAVVVALARYRAHLTLYFHRGVELPDPRGLLVGTASCMRGLKIRSAADLDERAIATWLRAGFALER